MRRNHEAQRWVLLAHEYAEKVDIRVQSATLLITGCELGLTMDIKFYCYIFIFILWFLGYIFTGLHIYLKYPIVYFVPLVHFD